MLMNNVYLINIFKLIEFKIIIVVCLNQKTLFWVNIFEGENII